MAKTKDEQRTSSADKPGNAAAAGPTGQVSVDGMRETVEAIVVAFILAFIFRTFVAEAFVIPTGSMATTLMGRHRDLDCPNCGYQYQLGDSEGRNAGFLSAVCPLCRFWVAGLETELGEQEFPPYNGDRIIVTKFSYALGDPDRWDVGVFRYPLKAATNYIKRIVGMPNEWLKIVEGDIYRRPADSTPDQYKIERKPPDKVVAMLRTVYDNDYIVDRMTQDGWPPRWQACPRDLTELARQGWPTDARDNQAPLVWSTHMPAEGVAGQGSWSTSDGFRSFATAAPAEPAWLRYRHFVPMAWPTTAVDQPTFSAADLAAIGEVRMPPFQSRHPLAINSFLAYNQLHSSFWVSDLALECRVDIEKAGQGGLILELVKGGERFQARLDLQAGTATLGRANGPGPLAATLAEIKGLPTSGGFDVQFANVDHKLYLWVNGRYLGGAEYEMSFPADPTAEDFSPVGIAAVGATAKVSHLRVLRDVYYSNPGRDAEYRMGEDEFFALGDNTDASSDSRYWGTGGNRDDRLPPAIPYEKKHTVHRDLLIGKALLIYWPHSWSYFRPNFARMGFIR